MPAVESLELTEQLPPIPEQENGLVIPDNLFVMTSHGTDEIPDYQRRANSHFSGKGAGELSEYFQYPNSLHAKDGSDHLTGEIGRHIMKLEQDAATTPPRAGRMFVDTNRSREQAKQVREETFGGAPIYRLRPSQEVQEQMVEEIWDTFHERAQVGVETAALESAPDDHTLVVDIHDTDEVLIDAEGNQNPRVLKNGETGFPFLILSDREDKASHPMVREILGQQLMEALVEVGLISTDSAKDKGFEENTEYKGGYTTERYGIDLPNSYLLRGDKDLQVKAQHLHFVQIELNRAMYVTADRMGIDERSLALTKRAITRALARTAEAIRDLELGDWRESPVEGSEEFERAMSMPLLAATDWYKDESGRRRAQPVAA